MATRSGRAAVRTALALAWGFAPRYSICSQVLLARVLATTLYQRGGDEETRTPDPLLAKEMLCQLSYVPRRQGSGGRYWTRTSELCLIRAALLPAELIARVAVPTLVDGRAPRGAP